MKKKGKKRRNYPEHVKRSPLPPEIRIPVPAEQKRVLAPKLKALGLKEAEIENIFSRANADRVGRRIKMFQELGLSAQGRPFKIYSGERDETVRAFLENLVQVKKGQKLYPEQRKKFDYLKGKGFPENEALRIARSGVRLKKLKERLEFIEGLEFDEAVYGRKKVPLKLVVELARIKHMALLRKVVDSMKLQWREETALRWLADHPQLNWSEERIRTGTRLSAVGLRQRAELILAQGVVPSFDDAVQVRLTKNKAAVKQAVKQAVEKRKLMAKRETAAEKRKALVEKRFLDTGVMMPDYVRERATQPRILNMLNYLAEKKVPLGRLAEKGWLGWFQLNEARFKRAVDRESRGKPQGNLISEKKAAAVLADLRKGDKSMLAIAEKHKVSNTAVNLIRNNNFVFSRRELKKIEPEAQRLLHSQFAGRKDEFAYRVLKNDVGLPAKEIAFLMAAFPPRELEEKVSLFLKSGLRGLVGGSFKAFQEYRKIMRFPAENIRLVRIPALAKRFKALKG